MAVGGQWRGRETEILESWDSGRLSLDLQEGSSDELLTFRVNLRAWRRIQGRTVLAHEKFTTGLYPIFTKGCSVISTKPC